MGLGIGKYYDIATGTFKRFKSIRYWDAPNNKWEHVRGDGSVVKGGFKYYSIADSKWWQIEVRQLMPLNQPGLYHCGALWHFDEMAGDIIEDFSGHGLDINRNSYAEKPEWAEGYFYGAMYFTNDRLIVPIGAYQHPYSNAHNWQIDVVFKLLGSVPAENKVFIGCRGATVQIWLGTSASTGRLQFLVRDNSGNLDNIIGTTNVYDSQWHKATATRENGIISVYLDGVLENSKDDNNNAGYAIDTTRWEIGWLSVGVFPQYSINTGYIDEIRVMEGILVTEF